MLIRAVLAFAATAIPAFQMIFFCKYQIAVIVDVIILVGCFIQHWAKLCKFAGIKFFQMIRFCCFISLFVCSFSLSAQWKKIYTSVSDDIYDISIKGHKTFAVGNNSLLLYSADTGNSWKKMTVAVPSNLRSVFFIDTLTGFVIGENARIQKTVDGGKNWSQKYVKTAAYGYDIAFHNNYGIAVGKDMLAVRSADGGDNWAVDTTLLLFKKLNSVAVTSFGKCWAVGDSGYILSKNITGKKWLVNRYPTKVDLNHVSTPNDSTIIIAGGMPDSAVVGKFYNIFLISTDSGNTWQQRDISEMKIINSAYFINADSGFLCGSNGIIVRCKAGIDVRGQQLSGVASTLNDVEYINGIGLIAGDGGTILRTRNFGGWAVNLNQPAVVMPFSVRPVPAHNHLLIQVSQSLENISIFSSLGQKVYNLDNPSGSIEITGLPNGVYTVVATDANGRVFQMKIPLQ